MKCYICHTPMKKPELNDCISDVGAYAVLNELEPEFCFCGDECYAFWRKRRLGEDTEEEYERAVEKYLSTRILNEHNETTKH